MLILRLVYLQSLSKLHKLTYVGRNDANIFKYVSRQICAISSPNSIAEVTISFELTYQRDKSAPELYRSIDKALSNLDTFTSLRRVEVDNSDLLEDFPCLHKRGILLGQWTFFWSFDERRLVSSILSFYRTPTVEKSVVRIHIERNPLPWKAVAILHVVIYWFSVR